MRFSCYPLFSIAALLGIPVVCHAENPKHIIEEILSNPEYQQELPDWQGNLPKIPTEEIISALEKIPVPETELPNIAPDDDNLSFLKGCTPPSAPDDEQELPPTEESRIPSKSGEATESSFFRGCAPSPDTPNLSEGQGPGEEIPREINSDRPASKPAQQPIEDTDSKSSDWDGASILQFIGILLLILLLSVLFSRFFEDRSEPERLVIEPSPSPDLQPTIQAADEPDEHLLSAEEMARQGRFSEAIHLLLLRSIVRLKNHVPQSDFLTAREISRKAPINRKAKHAFSKLLSIAELAHFGGRTLGQQEYQACAKHYQLFNQNLSAPPSS